MLLFCESVAKPLTYDYSIIIAMYFIQVERMGKWRLHLDCVRAILPIFHGSGHFPYAKSCQLYLQDMDFLEQKITCKEYDQFTRESFFTIGRSKKHCCIWSDMTIEQTLMKIMKIFTNIDRILNAKTSKTINLLKYVDHRKIQHVVKKQIVLHKNGYKNKKLLQAFL